MFIDNSHRYNHKSNKWWKKFFYTWLAICVANCHTIYTHFYKSEMDIKEFQEELITGLLESTQCDLSQSQPPSTNLANDHYPIKMILPKRCKVCYWKSETNDSTKSSFACNRCSIELKQDIPLHVLCFGEFHDDREKFLKKKKKERKNSEPVNNEPVESESVANQVIDNESVSNEQPNQQASN